MKFKSCNWLLWVIITLALIPSCVSAYFSPNLRQGSEPIFSIFASDADPFEPASTLSFSPLTSEISCQGSDTWRYGRHHAKELTPYLYTGRRYSPVSEQYFNRNRYYSPKVGRFTSKDPIGFSGGNNLWGYVKNNPMKFTDPFGFRDKTWEPPYNNSDDAIHAFLRNYYAMREANTIGADKYFHCKANCEAVRCPSGLIIAILISEGREFRDQFIKGDPSWACTEDRAANEVGRKGGMNSKLPCSEVCAQLRPNGLDPKY